MKLLAWFLSVALVSAALASCGGSSAPVSTKKTSYSVKGERLKPCDGRGSSKVWVLGLSCNDVPGELQSEVSFAETDLLGTQPVRVIRRHLMTAVYRTSKGWTCTPQVTGKTIYSTCWRGSQIVRFGVPAR
jgi:hypothetical protein